WCRRSGARSRRCFWNKKSCLEGSRKKTQGEGHQPTDPSSEADRLRMTACFSSCSSLLLLFFRHPLLPVPSSGCSAADDGCRQSATGAHVKQVTLCLATESCKFMLLQQLTIFILSEFSQPVPPSSGTKATGPSDSRSMRCSRRVKRTSSCSPS